MRAVSHDGRKGRHGRTVPLKRSRAYHLMDLFARSAKGVRLYLSAGLLSEQPREQRGWEAKPGTRQQQRSPLAQPKIQSFLRADSGEK